MSKRGSGVRLRRKRRIRNVGLVAGKHRLLVGLFADLLRPTAVPPTLLHEALNEAAKQAGWTPQSSKAKRRQKAAARGRALQRKLDQALRRIFVADIYKQLRPGLRADPSSIGTAQAIIGRLEKLRLDRMPPMSVRTIQEDIRQMKKNGNFGI